VERLHGSVQQAAKEVAQLLSLSRLEPDSGYAPAWTLASRASRPPKSAASPN
jgi:hypothetical protein